MNPREFCRERGLTTAILLTYDFDALFFERMALKDFWAGDTGDILLLADARRLSESAQRWQGQLQHLGRRYQLIPSNTPGAFHPKVMLRFGRDGGAVWLGSGNQTFGGWGGNQELCCAWFIGPGRRDEGRWVPRLLARIQSWSPYGLEYNIIQRATELPWLQSIPPEDQTGSETIVTSFERFSLASQLQRRWSGRRFTQIRILTGSTDENGALLARLNSDFGIERSVVILDERRASFRSEQLKRLPLETRVMNLPRQSPMHAKFYWFDGPDGPAAVMGSANCSAVAWLLPPESGGNIEAMAVYDDPDPEQFEEILTLFESENLVEARLLDSKSAPTANEREDSGLSLSELSWDSTLGEVRVKFNSSGYEISRVFVDFDDGEVELKVCGGNDRWCGEVPELVEHLQTVFVKIRIQLSSGTSFSYWRWLNDLVELRHASRGRHIADALRGLSKPNTSDEQQKMVASLHRISLALLSEPESFPDPVIRPAPTQSKTDSNHEGHMTAIDPDDFVCSIEDPDSPSRIREARRENIPLSLIGVMRALFPSEETSDVGDETDVEDEPDEPDDEKKKPTGKTRIPRPTAPIGRHKQKLRDDVEAFIYRLSQPQFAETCTATQLVQASAYPIAVAALGKKDGWVVQEDAVAWATRVFDVLFIDREKERGLLERVHTRYRDEGEEVAFLKIVGDGTLWLALLTSLFSLPPSIAKALALQSILKARTLIANTNAGRIEMLLGRLQTSKATVIISEAGRVSRLLSELEKLLGERFEDLKRKQEEMQLGCDVGDILWKPIAGWAESKAKGSWGANLKVHLHLRADIRLVSSKYFVNVTKSANNDPDIARILNLTTTSSS